METGIGIGIGIVKVAVPGIGALASSTFSAASECNLLAPASSSSSFFSSSVLGSHSLPERCRVGNTGGKHTLQNARLGALADASGLEDLRNESVVLCRMRGKNRRRNVRMLAEAGGTGNTNKPGETVQATLEQTKRLLAMQKELLKQMEERKKLYSELSDKFGNPTDQIQAFNEADTAIQNKIEQIRAIQNKNVVQISNSNLDSTEAVNGASETPLPPTTEASGAKKLSDGTRSPTARPLAASWQSPVASRTSSPSASPPIITPQSKPFVTQSPIQPFSPPSVKPSVAPSYRPLVTPAPNPSGKLIPATPTSLPQSAADVDEAIDLEADEDGTAEVEKPPPLAGPNVMNIVLVAAECAPWSKTGGLGDVVGALPKALARRGHRVMVVAPRYSNYLEAWDTTVRRTYSVAGQGMEIGYFHGFIDGVDFVFIDSPMYHGVANNIYGGSREDVLTRMVLLCKAAVEAPWHVPCGGVAYGDGNLIFIANDWHTALLPVYLQAYYRDEGLMQFTRAVLVIHNMAHQGRGPMTDFKKLGLPDHYMEKFKLHDPIGGEHCNVFKAGLITAHRIVTVSHGYASEVQTMDGGWGLHGIIGEHSWKLRGVVNGIDEKEWNPETDACLQTDGYSNFSVDDMSGKAACKAALQKEMGLPVRSDVPLIGFIGRLDQQKGVDILAEAMPWMMTQDLQLIMLGTGRPDLENMLRSFEHQHREKVRGWVGFSVKTAHRITAGVDILLMPSRFEPCGLNQLYAMKYGTVPVVHAVGGLKDTVEPFDPFSETGLGWTFNGASSAGLIHALGNCMWTFHDYKESWAGIQRRGMTQDLSWDNAAQLYEEVLLAAKYQW